MRYASNIKYLVCINISTIHSHKNTLHIKHAANRKKRQKVGLSMGGSKEAWGTTAPIQKSAPLWPPNEVHHADILTEVYSVASLGLQVQVCQ